MFKGALLTPVLVLSLLLCPFHCMGILTGAESGSLIAEGGCSCCERQFIAGQASSENPESPLEDGICGNCSCHGAIAAEPVDFSLVLADWSELETFSLATISLMTQAGRPPLQNRRTDLADLRPASHCSICIIHQSLLL